MSIKNREVPFTYIGSGSGPWTLAGIRELGFTGRGAFIIDGWVNPPPEPRGGYFTSLPISPRDWRRSHGQGGCAYARELDRLLLWDDWGNRYSIEAPPEVLDLLEAECDENEIPLTRGESTREE